MVSVAEGLRMMQGGVDRTGFADMYESLGDPLARIRANREAARQQALLDAMMEVDDTEPGTGTNNVPGTGTNNVTDLIINDELFNMLSESAVDARGALGRGPNLSLPKFDTKDTKPKLSKPKDIPKPNTNTLLKILNIGKYATPTGAFLGIMSPSSVADATLSGEEELYDFYDGMADGGRVEMQLGGGLMNNLLGQPGVQQGLQNQIYQQPTFDFQPMPSPNPGLGMPPPPATAQAYNPFVSNMPLYDPSTLGTGLPSTAGMTDPYFSYDPYSAAGAFDAPPANIGGFLSRKEIEDTFKDLDKFTLTKQEEKRKAAEEAAKKKVVKERDGGQGGGGDRGSNKTNGGSKSCFVKGTMLQMADGTEKEISTVELGDNTKGGIVEMTMQGLPQTIYNYKGVLVSGSHWVIEDNEFVAVEDSKHGVLTDKVEPVYTLKTSEHRMWINDIEFGDFETGSDDDWEPHFEAVRKKLNEELRSGHI
jgi:hypothetical protein